jgi:hypothetical protein
MRGLSCLLFGITVMTMKHGYDYNYKRPVTRYPLSVLLPLGWYPLSIRYS